MAFYDDDLSKFMPIAPPERLAQGTRTVIISADPFEAIVKASATCNGNLDTLVSLIRGKPNNQHLLKEVARCQQSIALFTTWEEKQDVSGNRVYYNRTNKTFHKTPPLPPGWVMVNAKRGDVYYSNTVKKTTQPTRPDPWSTATELRLSLQGHSEDSQEALHDMRRLLHV
jgi:hypothetical protein